MVQQYKLFLFFFFFFFENYDFDVLISRHFIYYGVFLVIFKCLNQGSICVCSVLFASQVAFCRGGQNFN